MRRRYNDDEDDPIVGFVSLLVIAFLVYLVGIYFKNRMQFWHLVIYGLIVVGVIIVGIIGFRRLKQKSKQQKFDVLLEQILSKGQKDYINNFISRFGFEGKKGRSWSFRNYFFEWDRIADLEKYLKEKGILLKNDGENKDIYTILRHYIQEREENLTRESITKTPQKFVLLTGPDFEGLLYRLFQAMGYAVQRIGKSGDQGGDIIANKDGERVLIQAKCYSDWSTGNAAVQQVVGAMKFYDCNKAMVVTTSYFTKEAIALAKANNTELISKERLQEMLMENLKESWV